MISSKDPLQKALESRGNHSFEIPVGSGQLFPTKINIQNLGLTLTQRFVCFILCLVLGCISLIYSFFKVITGKFVLNPISFVLPYAFSNLMFFVMIGFIIGFKTYYKNLFKEDKRYFTLSFLFSTFFTLFFSSKSSSIFIAFGLMIIQISTFACFIITFIPNGSSMLKNVGRTVLFRNS